MEKRFEKRHVIRHCVNSSSTLPEIQSVKDLPTNKALLDIMACPSYYITQLTALQRYVVMQLRNYEII
jgi:hypothetical protein